MNDICVNCGRTIPEGRQVCLSCENRAWPPDAILEDGTHLYLKTKSSYSGPSLQLQLYDLLTRRLNEN